jgi:hypothetical protein
MHNQSIVPRTDGQSPHREFHNNLLHVHRPFLSFLSPRAAMLLQFLVDSIDDVHFTECSPDELWQVLYMTKQHAGLAFRELCNKGILPHYTKLDFNYGGDREGWVGKVDLDAVERSIRSAHHAEEDFRA